MPKLLLNTKEAAAFLGITYAAMCNRVLKGKGPPSQGQRPNRKFRLEDLEAYKESYAADHGGGYQRREHTIAFTIRLPATLHGKILAAAQAEKRTLTAQVELMLEKVL